MFDPGGYHLMSRPPVIVVSGRSLADTWERAVLEVWSTGLEVPTEYGEKAKEATLLMTVEEPFTEPRVHRGDVVAAMGTRSYVEEVLEGTLDRYVQEGKLPYTYHERLYSYRTDGTVLDQIEQVRGKLRSTPFTRRAQAITWQPAKDLFIDSPPCLQRVWFKIYDRSLVLETEWRSRDLFRAAHMNMLALTELQ
ncbi:MAG: thymidylate synthase, partial [Candidatus Bathyarchaeia archaeon]